VHKRVLRPLAAILFLSIALSAASPARAACQGGFSIYLSGQVPDVHFISGTPSTIHFNPWYFSFSSTSGSCGIVARSTTPGVSIQQTDGCFPGQCAIFPPGQWAPVGSASPTSFSTVQHKTTDIPIVFDGTAPPGTYGQIEIGIRDNDLGIPSQAIIGTANVFVSATSVPPLTWFDLFVTSTNGADGHLYVDHPYLNGNPNGIFFYSHSHNPDSGLPSPYWDHTVQEKYDATLGKWYLDLGGTPPIGLKFAIRIDPAAMVVCAPGQVSPPSYTPSIAIPSALANGNPFATILAVQRSGPDWFRVAAGYSAPTWKLVSTDGGQIRSGTCFNVKVFSFSQYRGSASTDLSQIANVGVNWGVGVDANGLGTGHTAGNSRRLLFDWAVGRSARNMIVTHNVSPMGFSAPYDFGLVGLSSPPRGSTESWMVFHENGTALSVNQGFSVWGPCVAAAWYPNADGDGYGGPGDVQASCVGLTGYATTGGDCDDTDATRYPGSVEINDGRDNTCPGVAGAGLIDEISTSSQFFSSSSFCWSAQTGATAYQVVRSLDPSFSSCTSLGTTSSTCLADSTVPPPGESFYYLVRAASPWPGSWGEDSSGNERFPSCP